MKRTLVASLWLLFGSIATTSVLLADDPLPLAVRAEEQWSGVFGGREIDFHFVVTSTAKAEVRGSWSLAVDERAIARRETMLTVDPDNPGRLTVRFELPMAREGVVLPIDLTVSVDAGQEQASVEKRLWLFPDDPFALEQKWLEGLKITVFDPAGATSRLFSEAKIPFKEIRTIEQAAALDDGLLVVGEGVSWTKLRALPKVVFELADHGVAVLALAPADGSLSLPGSVADDLPAAQSLSLRRADVIAELDKRFDAVAWPPDGKLQTAGVQISAERGRVVGRFVEGAEAWPWLECRFAAPRGRLILCGFPIVKCWNAGPTPRFLFARMLKRLTGDEKLSEEDEAESGTKDSDK